MTFAWRNDMSVNYVTGLRPKDLLDEVTARKARHAVRRLLLKLGLSETCKLLGRSKSTVGAYQDARSNPTTGVWEKIQAAAKLHDVEIDPS